MSNTRIITALVAFVAAFIFSDGLVRLIFPVPVTNYVYTERPRTFERKSNDIEMFLLRDISNGDARMDYRYTENYPEAVMDYWNVSSNMDASAFPQDFQNAWRAHMNAWHDYAEYLQDKKNAKSSYSCSLEKQYNNEINRTWEEVLRIGRNNGSSLR